jgi:hypothetical protein
MRELSDRTLVEQFAKRLSRARVYQLFLLDAGTDSAAYVSAFALGRDGNVVEAKAAGFTIEQALNQLLLNIDQATEEP